MKKKRLICPECKNELFEVSIGSEESMFCENHRTQLIVFKCTKCKREYAMQNEILNTRKESVENDKATQKS